MRGRHSLLLRDSYCVTLTERLVLRLHLINVGKTRGVRKKNPWCNKAKEG